MFIEPRGSALDRYEPTKQSIAQTQSLDELLAMYESSNQKVIEAEKENPLPESEDRFAAMHAREDQEPFKSHRQLKEAIVETELHHSQLAELHFFWMAGVVISIVGAVVYVFVQQWPGISLCTLGVLEMIWATSPSFTTVGSLPEFDRLLTFKLIYSVVSVLLVAVGWVIAAKLRVLDGGLRTNNPVRPNSGSGG